MLDIFFFSPLSFVHQDDGECVEVLPQFPWSACHFPISTLHFVGNLQIETKKKKTLNDRDFLADHPPCILNKSRYTIHACIRIWKTIFIINRINDVCINFGFMWFCYQLFSTTIVIKHFLCYIIHSLQNVLNLQ